MVAARGWLRLTVLAPSHLRPRAEVKHRLRRGSELRPRRGSSKVVEAQSVLVRHRLGHVNQRQQHEDVRLNQRDEDVEAEKEAGNGEWQE